MNRFRIALLPLAALTVTLIAIPPGFAAPESKPVLGFTLSDTAGKSWKLHDQKAKAVVVAVLSTECPMSNGYLSALADVSAKYAAKGVAVVGVFPDPDTTAAQLAAHAKEYKVPFTLLRDETQAAVTALGAKVTPEVFVLDDKYALRYRGRIDDGFSARLKAKSVTRHDLVAALDEVLAGKPVSVPETTAFGCPVPEPAKKPAATAAVTFHKDVLPVLQAHCQSCHRPNQVGPFALMNYKQAARWADLCLEEVKAKRMPPWKPEKNDLLRGERTLPADAVQVLEKWVAQSMPEGDPKDAPPPAKFTDGWTLGEPDLVLETPEEVTVGADGRDTFRVVVLPTNLPEDRYITAVEVKPGNPRVVHHTLQVIDTAGRARKLQADAQTKAKPDTADRGPGYTVMMGFGFVPDPGSMLGGWAPGMLPKKLPDGVALKLPKGADVCLQIHYHRTGKEEKDRTKVGLYFTDKPVTELYRSIPAAGLFGVIPAGQKAFKVDSSWRLTADATVYRLVPHMHLLGKDIELRATVPGGQETTLIRIPEWDYNWQEQYELKEPMKLPKGTVLRVRATYDNSAANPNNPSNPPRMVGVGEQTTDEMCFVFVGVSTPSTARRIFEPVGGLFKK